MASDARVESTSDSGAGDNHRALVALSGRTAPLPALPWPYAGRPPRPEILTSRPTPVDLLHALRRCAILALGIGMLVGGLLAALVWLFMPIRFEGMALVRIMKVKPDPFGEVATSSDEYETYKRTQLQLIKSNFVLVRASRKLESAKVRLIQEHSRDPVQFLEDYLQVDNPGEAELMRVALKGPYRDDLPKIVNAVVDAYMDEIVNAERNEQLKRRDTLDRTVSKNREDIRKKLSQFHQLANQLGTASSETAQVKKKMALDRLTTLTLTINKQEEMLRDEDVKIALIKLRQEHPEATEVPDYMVDAELNRDPQVAQLLSRITQLRQAIRAQTALTVNGKSLSLQRLQHELTDQEQELDDQRASLTPPIHKRLVGLQNGGPTGAAPGVTLPMLEKERELMAENLKTQQEVLEKEKVEVQKLDANSSELESSKAVLEELQLMTNKMSSKLREINLQLDSPSRIQVVERATPPQKTDAIKKYITVVLAGLAGFGLVLFGAAFLEFQGRRLNSSVDVNQGLGLSVIGELPPLSGRSWRKIRSGGDTGSQLQALLTESIDSVRATLVHSTSVESPRVVLVTSAEPQEGKTTVASQLAASLARSGRRTLLVDGDIRCPAAHRVFELPLEPGLCEVLRGEVEHEAVIQPTHAANLWLMTAGRCDARSIQGLSHSPLKNLLSRIKDEFDFVVIDSAPVLKVADPLLIGQHVDAAVLSVLRDVSTVPGVYDASNRLSSVGITVLGVVVNGIPESSRHYYSGASITAPEDGSRSATAEA